MMIDEILAGHPRRGMMEHLTSAQWELLRAECSHVRVMRARHTVSHAGERLDASLLLLDGLAVRYVGAPENRQMVALQVPFDFVDLHALPLGHLDHDIHALTDARLAVFPHESLRGLMRRDPDLGERLWRLTMIDAAIHRQWTWRLGSLRALAGMAHFLCELDTRMGCAGHGGEDGFDLPLTQADLADVTGLSVVHVNRTLRSLREAGLATLANGRLTIHDRARLCRLASFEPEYLYLRR